MITKRTITSIWCSFFKDGIDLHAIGKINYIGGKWEWGVYDANYYDFIRAYKNGQEEVIDYLKTQGTSETFKGSDEEYRNKLATFIDQYKYIGTANLLKAPFVLRKIIDKLYTQDYETATEDNSDKLAEEISSHIIHDELNPKLWNEDNTLKPEVKDKITAIVKEFTDYLERDEIKFNIVDIRLVGSNCSYNYNDSSDLDIHIVMDTDSLQCPDNLYPLLYSAYRSLFNGKMDIEFYGIPVELYIETSDTEQQDDVIAEARNQSAVRSTGIYSVLQDKWIKEPVAEAIPEVDEEEFNKIWAKWETEYNNIIKSIPEATECLKQAENDQFEDSDLTEPDILNDEGKVSYQKVLDLDLEEEPILKLNEEAVYGLFLTEIDPKTGKKISSEWDNKGPIEKGTKAEMTALKPKYEDNLNVNRYGRVYKCVVRFIGNTSFEEDLLESLENTITKYTDEHEIHKSIDNLIEDEWQAIAGYQEVVDTLKRLKGKDYSVIKVLQDISDEEQVHVGELQKCLSQVDHDVLDTIDQGEAEATEILDKDTDDLDEDLKNITVYHGSSTNISKFSFPIQWFSTSIKYATQFATWVGKNHYLYTCKIAPKNILELGNTDGPVYTLLPLKPYKFSPEFKQIIDNLGISEDEARAIVLKVAGDPHREYTCKIHWITRDIDFCKVVKSKGYDCMKATEAGATTYGVLDPEIVTIIDKKVISDSKEYNEDIDSKIDYDVTGKEDTKIMKLNGKEVEVPIWDYEKVESQDSLKEESTGLEISWEDAIKDSYDFLVSSSGQIPTASQVLEDVVDNYDLDIDIEIELDDPIKYNKWLSDVEHVLNTLGLEVEEESINEELNDYWVISDGKDPRRSSIYTSIDNLDKFIAQLEANKEGKGYWELLHYVNGKDTKVWDTETGRIKTESLKEDYKDDKLWLVEKILEHTIRRAYLTKEGEFEVFSSVEDPTIKDKCELFTYDEAIAKKKEIQDKYPNDIIWVWYSGDVQIDSDKTKTTVVYNGKEYNED